jgi:hypothetical protein
VLAKWPLLVFFPHSTVDLVRFEVATKRFASSVVWPQNLFQKLSCRHLLVFDNIENASADHCRYAP